MSRHGAVIMWVTPLLGVVLVGCVGTPEPPVAVCATQDRPPIVLADDACPGPGAQVYSAPASEIDGDDWPVPGQPLDGDFWDLADQLDLDEAHRVGRSGSHHGTRTVRPSATRIVVTTGSPLPGARPATPAPTKTKVSTSKAAPKPAPRTSR